jgi:phosphoribosyl 1,2-cyclic phosphate phosphodiesterase
MKKLNLRIHVLGSGTSTGVPLVACDCNVCMSTDPKDKRLRSSLLIEDLTNQQNILIDTSPDLRAQLLATKIFKIDHLIYTHTHADHTQGFDDLRALFFKRPVAIQCWLQEEHKKDLEQRFAYAFGEKKYNGTTPQVVFNKIAGDLIKISGLDIEWISLKHGYTQSTAIRINDFAYATDFKKFSPEQISLWKNKISTMIVSGVGLENKHPSHSGVYESVELLKDLGVKTGYITHLSHTVDYKKEQKNLPKSVYFAYDGMIIDL